MFFLLASGLVAIFSISSNVDHVGFSNFEKQLVFLVIGLATFFFFSYSDYRIWTSYSGIFYIVGILLLLVVLFLGRTVRGTSGWFNLGFFNIQPVELMKLFLIILLAKYFSKNDSLLLNPKQIAISFIYVLIPVLLAIKQPDMGSAVVMLAIWSGMFFLAGTRKKYLFGILGGALVVLFLSWNLILKDYQRQRVQAFLNPEADPLGSGYNVIQSTVAVGSGGIGGKGLGYGSQSQLNFLPEKHTDFIYATIAEESGLIGAGFVLGLFWLLLYRMKKTMDIARDNFGRLLVWGVLVMLFFQLFINVGMNLGVMPVAGLSLPFLSYGGSFLLIVMATMGMVQNVWRKSRGSLQITD
jgi:rod shape determining protein RodA